jgi:hypothetical protein
MDDLPIDHPCYNIPLDLRIKSFQYSNDDEYRGILDLLCFHKDDMQYILDFVWENTFDIPAFHDLYILAASNYLASENASLGLAILFSYDYLCDFYPFFREYMTNLEFDGYNNSLFITMKNKLAKK